VGKMIDFQRPDGAASKGYLADCAPGAPAVVVIQEWWGLNKHICGIADRFAAAGFTALAPDLYRGRIASSRDEARHLMDGLDFPDATHQDLRGAVRHLTARGSKVGVVGYCMGGALAVAAAVHLPEAAAAVCFYGMPPKTFADPADMRVPFQGHFAVRDDWVTPQLVEPTIAAMAAAGVVAETYIYDAAHAFFNADRPEVFDATAATLAWDRTIAFFSRHLGTPSA
jgi:carboxymethylenebutenolidase